MNVGAEDIRTRLVEAGQRRAAAEQARAAALAEIGVLLRAGRAAGLPVQAMIQAAGIARQTAYDLLASS